MELILSHLIEKDGSEWFRVYDKEGTLNGGTYFKVSSDGKNRDDKLKEAMDCFNRIKEGREEEIIILSLKIK